VCRTAVIPGVISSKERGLKLKTCRNIIDASFRAMVRDARAVDELIDKDPFAALEWPRAEETEPDPFTENERDRILNHFGNVLLPVHLLTILDGDETVGGNSP
jgi:hypothetical protein